MQTCRLIILGNSASTNGDHEMVHQTKTQTRHDGGDLVGFSPYWALHDVMFESVTSVMLIEAGEEARSRPNHVHSV